MSATTKVPGGSGGTVVVVVVTGGSVVVVVVVIDLATTRCPPLHAEATRETTAKRSGNSQPARRFIVSRMVSGLGAERYTAAEFAGFSVGWRDDGFVVRL